MLEELDRFSMEDIFRTRVPTLKSCPHFSRGRLRRERHRAKMVQDELSSVWLSIMRWQKSKNGEFLFAFLDETLFGRFTTR